MTLERRMLNKQEAKHYMHMTDGEFNSVLQEHNYSGVTYGERRYPLYDIKVLDQILDSYQPTHVTAPHMASFESAWKGVTA